jgi:hypothetical protein
MQHIRVWLQRRCALNTRACFCMIWFIAIYSSIALGQEQNPSVTRQIIDHINTYNQDLSIEKLYLQIDRNDYGLNDTLWFKGYLMNAQLNPSTKSGVMYIEIADADNQVIIRNMVSVYAGQAWGSIVMDEKSYPVGTYTLRAYTNWMRNYTDRYIFSKQFNITNTNGSENWLISTRLNPFMQEGKAAIKAGLAFRNLQQQAISVRDVEVSLITGRKNWFKIKFMTGVDGALDFNFQLPEKADPNKLSIKVKEFKKEKNGAEYILPVLLNRKDHIDLQFMPEGGALVAGLKSNVAFKALGEDGNSVNVSGVIYDSKQQQVTTFRTTHLGMGDVTLQPQPGETYTAIIKIDSAKTKSYPLPLVQNFGMVLSVVNPTNSDSLTVTVAATPDLIASSNIYYLVGQGRETATFGAAFKPEGNGKQFHISKNAFPTGIVRFTILTNHTRPLNERMVFIDHQGRLCINMSPDKKIYGKRDSAAVNITVTNKAGEPVVGVFSMAVTDDQQVSTDAIKMPSLLSAMLLCADLKGDLEEPGYYFKNSNTEEIAHNLDNLLLTQGWVNYTWDNVFLEYRTEPKFAAEKNFTIKGRVSNMFNKGVASSGVTLLSKKPAMVLDTVTNATGEFTFANIYPADTAAYVIQARNKRGKSFNVGIDMIEFVPPVFTASTRRTIPSYMNLDSSKISTVNNRVAYKLEQDKLMGIHQLKEVAIKDKKVIKDSKNLNGDGESDFALNEADMEKARKMTLGDVLRKNVKGLSVSFKNPMSPYYVINFEILYLIIDGVSVPKLIMPGITPEQLYNQYFDYFTAEDIKGIEVMHPGRFGGRYFQTYIENPLDYPNKYCFIEVTTRSGHGPFYKSTPGAYVYKPIPFVSPKQFYSPKYLTKDKTLVADIRSTIYWAPNIVTDKDGKATVSFYTADKPGTYTMLMEGCDMIGNIESSRAKIIVK